MLEDDRQTHLLRALAQLDDNGELTQLRWMNKNPDEARDALARHQATLDGLAPKIDCADNDQLTLPQLLTWIEARCQAGYRVIGIDPITAAATGDKRFLEDLEFIFGAKRLAKQFGASLILMTHPRKGAKGGSGWDDMAGGAAYPKFAHNVLWMRRFEQPKRVLIKGPCGDFNTNINRAIRMGKCRFGRGSGLEIGYTLDRGLGFTEQGVIVREVKGEQADTATDDPFLDKPKRVVPSVQTLDDL